MSEQVLNWFSFIQF